MVTRSVVSNTSPLIALAAIESFELLGQVYETVHIPGAVLRELQAGEATGIAVPPAA